ncbi:replication factor A protein 2 [Tulasnella sp. UAMH 9824]|nr:replication factor A protein 2 [Tulasnella sp. UAMH 9824]
MTDYYGTGGGFVSGSQGSPGGSPGGSRTRHTSLRPVVCRQILTATKAGENETIIDGVECTQLTFVGQIHNVNQQATNLVMTLDDGTGQVEIRQWLDGGMDLDQLMDKQGIQENEWIRVLGTVKYFGGKRTFNAMVIRPVKDPHEIYFAMLEALQVHMFYTRGAPTGASQGLSNNSQNAYNAATSTTNAGSAMGGFGHLPPMERKIVQHIINSAPGEEGIHVTELTKGLGPNINAEDVSNALDRLTEAGHIFNTIDEFHYQIST